jgi:WD40 repeat protein
LIVAVVLALLFASAEAQHARREATARKTITAQANNLARQSKALAASLTEERKRRVESQLRLANFDLERGETLCAQGKADEGLLWLARALNDLPEDRSAADQERIIRMSLGGWSRRLHPLVGSVKAFERPRHFPTNRFMETEEDDVFRLRELTTQAPIGPPLRHTGYRFGAFSPDGKVFLSYGGLTAQLWDTDRGQLVAKPLVHQSPVRGAEFGPDGTIVVTRSEDGTAQPWDAVSGQPLGQPWPGQNRVDEMVFSPDGKVLLMCSREDHTAQLWEVAPGRTVGAPLPSRNDFAQPVFSADGKVIVTLDDRRTPRLWNAATGQPIGAPLLHEPQTNGFTFSPQGTRVLTWGEDHEARLWEAASGQPIGSPLVHQGSVAKAQFSPDGKTILTATANGSARLWDVASGQPIGIPMQHPPPVHEAQFSPDGKTILTYSHESVAQLWDGETGVPVGSPLKHRGRVHALVFRPDGKAVLAASEGQTARLWDVATGQPLGRPIEHQAAVSSMALDPDGKVVTGSEDDTAQIWDSATGRPIGRRMQHSGAVTHVAFSPDGTTVLTGSFSGKDYIRRWDAATGEPRAFPLQQPNTGITRMAVSPDGKAIASFDLFALTRVWDTDTGQAIYTSNRGSTLVPGPAVAFSRDGKTFVTFSHSGYPEFWDVARRKLVGTFGCQAIAIHAADFSPDGLTVLTAGATQIWDVASGRPVGPRLPHPGPTTAVAFRPDGKAVLTGGTDGAVRLWKVPIVEGKPDQVQLGSKRSRGRP